MNGEIEMTKVLIPYKDCPKEEHHKYANEGDTVLIKESTGHAVGRLYGTADLLKVEFCNTANGYAVESPEAPIKVEMQMGGKVELFYISLSDALNLEDGNMKYLCLEPKEEDEDPRAFKLLEFGSNVCTGEEVKTFHLLGYGNSKSVGMMNIFN